MSTIDSISRFEAKALAFYKLTSKLAPGKDVPSANPHCGATLEEYDAWNAAFGDVVNKTILACWEIFGDRE